MRTVNLSFYHIYHRTVLFRFFLSRLVLSPSSPVPPSLIDDPFVPSTPVLSHLVLLFSIPSSFSIEIQSHPVKSLFFPCCLNPICQILTCLVLCHPLPSCSVSPFLVPHRSVLLHQFPSLPALSRPIPGILINGDENTKNLRMWRVAIVRKWRRSGHGGPK